MKYLIDTCVISEIIKKEPHAAILKWFSASDEGSLYLSVLTLGEIQKGISCIASSRRKNELQSWLHQDLKNRFENRLLNITLDVSILWGKIQANAEKKGLKMPVIDSLIAATALAHNMVVVTRNGDDMKQSGVQIINPWIE